MTALLAVLLAGSAWAQNPPYTVTETKSPKDAAALNQDVRALADALRKSNSFIRTAQAALPGTSTVTYVTTYDTQTISGIKTFAGQVALSSTVTGAYNLAWASSTSNQTLSATTWETITDSTVTITLNGGKRVRVSANLAAASPTLNAKFYIRAQHGAGVLGGSVGNCILIATAGTGSEDLGCAFSVITAPLAAGATTFSLQGKITTGNWTITPAEVPWVITAEEIR